MRLFEFVILCSVVYSDIVSERDVLIDLYNHTNGPNWRHHENWLNESVCSWANVYCNPSNTTILYLDFRDNWMNGFIPPSFGALSNLLKIDMSNNPGLGGEIPQELGNLTHLQVLNFGDCDFIGDLSFLARLTNLIELKGINNRRLTSSLPEDLGNCKNIIYLSFLGTPLTGDFPQSICAMKFMTEMYFQNTFLTGFIPPWNCFRILQRIDLSYTLMSGTFPIIDTRLPLKSMRFSHMKLTGKILGNFSFFPILGALDTSHNYLSGITDTVCDLPIITILKLNNNELTALPNCSFQGYTLVGFDASYNSITHVPALFWNSPSLSFLNLSNNDITQSSLPLPDILPKKNSLKSQLAVLSLSNNPLGSIWEVLTFFLWPFEELSSLYVSNCSLTRNLTNHTHAWYDIPAAWEVLDVSWNPQMKGVFSLRPLDADVDLIVAGTQLGVDVQENGGALSVYLDISNRIMPEDCNTCLNPKIFALGLSTLKMDNLPCARNYTERCGDLKSVRDDTSVWDYSASPKYLFCPTRRTLSGGQIIADSDFLDYRGCACASEVVWWNGSNCDTCPENVVCDPNVNNPIHRLKLGYWAFDRNTKTLAAATNYTSSILLMCSKVEICNASGPTGELICGEGRVTSSLLCSKCESNYFPSGQDCISCGTWYIYFVPCALPLTFILVAALLWKKAATIDKSAQLAIAVFAMQVLGALELFSPIDDASGVSTTFEFPREILNFRPWAIECVTDYATFQNKFWAQLLFPVFILMCGLPWLWWFSNNPERKNHIKKVLVCAFDFLYLPLAGTILSVYNCVPIGNEDYSYLSNVPYLTCKEGVIMQGVGAVGGLVYIIGFPAFLTWNLYQDRINLEEKDRESHQGHPYLQFLLGPLKTDNDYVWAIPGLFLMRKLAIVALLNLINLHSGVMPLTVAVFVFCCEMAVLGFQPYKRKRDTSTEIALIAICAVLYLVRIFQNSEGDYYKFAISLANARVVFEVLAYGGALLVLAIAIFNMIKTALIQFKQKVYACFGCARRAPYEPLPSEA